MLAQLASSSNTASLPNPLHRGRHQIKFLDLMHTQNDLFGQAAQTASRAHPPQASHRQGLSYKAVMSCRRSTPTGFTLGRTRSAHKTHRDTVLRMYVAGLRCGNVFFYQPVHIHMMSTSLHAGPACAGQERVQAGSKCGHPVCSWRLTTARAISKLRPLVVLLRHLRN